MADMKEMDLYGFLHPEITPDKEIIVSSRFKTKGGDPLPFVIRPLTQDICDAIQREEKEFPCHQIKKAQLF